VILPNIKDNSDVECVIHKIMAEFEETYSLLDQNIYITSTIGISLFPKDGDNTHTLLKHADTAMYQAKDDGRNRFRFFDQSLNDHLLYQRNIASNLRHSLDLDQFHLVFQPQIDLREKRITSCEALLRWTPEPPVVGVTPDIFIPIAERSDLIIHIGNWVLKNACIQLAQWRENGIEDIRIDINVSARQLDHSRFIPTFEQTLHTYNLRPKDIGIELTEHALIKANKDLLEKLDRLRSSGVNVSIDDFGTGYSSLNYLRQFPVNYLKIDRDFVTEAPNSKKDEAILRAIIEVGHALDLLIVVEGVETQCQAQFCQDMGSDLAQGYWYFKPMAADKILPILLNDKS
jgi:EAL domain-containing protein (putative c-di-GMP-specific phosphodiesterase class I)